MASVSPPKPWERGAAAASNSSGIHSTIHAAPVEHVHLTQQAALTSLSSAATPTSAATPSSSAAPALPSRPDSLNSVVNQNASNYTSSHYGQRSPYGYGGAGMSSPYSRFGSGYGGMGGGLGGGMYGGGMYGGGMGGGMYGSPYGGGGMYGNGYGAMGQQPNQSLTQSFSQSTQATFQIIESIVGAFGGFAQMLESTYMATHSSFFGP